MRSALNRTSFACFMITLTVSSTSHAEPANVELTTLRLLHEKKVISDEEYDAALRDIGDSTGKLAAESTTFVAGKWATSLYGFVEADHIYDTTQSFNDIAGNAQVARPGTFAGDHDRLTFGIRNSRLGLRLKAPEHAGIRTSAQLEMDFLGTQLPVGYGQPYFGSEGAFFTNPTFRVRHANLRVETDVVDFLFGQYWQLFGWQNTYHPNTVEIQGVPGQIYSRTPQIRISKTIKTAPVTFEVAVAAMRPPQRDSAVPEGQAGLRLAINDWKGMHTGGATATSVMPASIAVTGDLRQVRLPVFLPNVEDVKTRTAGAIALDAFVPVLPATEEKRDNALAFVGELATGYGTSDLYTGLSGGVTFPALPNPANLNPAPTFPQDIDNGIVTYDANGGLHFILWTSYIVGAEYYVYGLNGKVWLSGNYSHLSSSNASNYGAAAKIRTDEDWFDVNVFSDVAPAVRLGLEYANFNDRYADGTHAINHRVQFSAFYIF